jgi:hypothetical protein
MTGLVKSRLNALGYWLPAALCLISLACSASDTTRAVREDPSEAQVRPNPNLCPTFSFYMVLPQRIRDDEPAVAIVYATDVDSDDAKLTYAWSATAGDFTHPDETLTEYSCAGLGPQQLKVTTRDPDGCESVLALDVDCLEH